MEDVQARQYELYDDDQVILKDGALVTALEGS